MSGLDFGTKHSGALHKSGLVLRGLFVKTVWSTLSCCSTTVSNLKYHTHKIHHKRNIFNIFVQSTTWRNGVFDHLTLYKGLGRHGVKLYCGSKFVEENSPSFMRSFAQR